LLTKRESQRSRKTGRAKTAQKSSKRVGKVNLSLKPDHVVRVKHIKQFSNINIAAGYFDAYEVVKPFEILSTSSYAPLLKIYESMRVTRIQVKAWMGNVSVNTPGYTAFMYFRDVLTTVQNRYVEQLIVEPGSKRGRPVQIYNGLWKPIEPSDYEFYDHAQFADMDNAKYGQVNFAGASFGGFEINKPLIEFVIDYTFKSLVLPEVPPSIVRLHDGDDFDHAEYYLERPLSSHSVSSRPITAQRSAVYRQQ